MARHPFGGTIWDWVVNRHRPSPSGRLFATLRASRVVFYESQSGGAKILDLQDAAGNPITDVDSDVNGFLPTFYGPDGVQEMWADGGAGTERRLIVARDRRGEQGETGAPGGSDAAFAGWVTDDDSDTRAALSATYAGLTEPLFSEGADQQTPAKKGTTTVWVEEPALVADPARYDDIDLTGVTESTGLQALFDSLGNTSYHKSIRLLPGIYYAPNGFVLNRANVTLEGAGPSGSGTSGTAAHYSTTELRASAAGASVLTLGNASSTDWRGAVLRDIGFSDASAGNDQVTKGVRVLRQNAGRMERCSWHHLFAATCIYAEPVAFNPQYWHVDQPIMFDVLNGVASTGVIADWMFVGGFMWGARVAAAGVRPGSIGFLDKGTTKVFGTSIQYFETDVALEGTNSDMHITVEASGQHVSPLPRVGVEFRAASYGNHVVVEHANAHQYTTGRAVSLLAGSAQNRAVVSCNQAPAANRVVDDNNGSTGNWISDHTRGGDSVLALKDQGALPTASAAYRGKMRYAAGAAGVADGIYVCLKDAANAYSWVQVA